MTFRVACGVGFFLEKGAEKLRKLAHHMDYGAALLVGVAFYYEFIRRA